MNSDLNPNNNKVIQSGFFFVELNDEQVKLLIKTCQEKAFDLESISKNPDGISEDLVRDLQLELRNLNDVIRELKFFTKEKKIDALDSILPLQEQEQEQLQEQENDGR